MIHSLLRGVGKAEAPLGTSPVAVEMDGLELLLGRKRRKQLCDLPWSWIVVSVEL